MKQKSGLDKAPAEQVLKNIRRQTDTPAVFGRREDPHCAGGTTRRREHLGALLPRGHRRLDVLRLVQDGVPYHPETQGKLERWHQTLKNRILLENYHLSGDLEQQIDAFVEHYNHVRYHESLNNLTPADVYFGRAETILVERERIKRATTIANRRLQHQLQSA